MVLAIKKHHGELPFPSAALLLFAHVSRQLSATSPAPLCPQTLAATYTALLLGPFGYYTLSSTTLLTVNLNIPFLIYFHVTVSQCLE